MRSFIPPRAYTGQEWQHYCGNQTAYDIMIHAKGTGSFDTSDFCNIFNLSRDNGIAAERCRQTKKQHRDQSVIFLRKSLTNSYTRFLEKS